jgi:hypothetical protein
VALLWVPWMTSVAVTPSHRRPGVDREAQSRSLTPTQGGHVWGSHSSSAGGSRGMFQKRSYHTGW